jgi:hypothetical protein
MTAATALFCADANTDVDPARCPCAIPPGMVAEPWKLTNGHGYRILTSDGDDAGVFAVQFSDGSIDDGAVVERPAVHADFHSDERLTPAQLSPPPWPDTHRGCHAPRRADALNTAALSALRDCRLNLLRASVAAA